MQPTQELLGTTQLFSESQPTQFVPDIYNPNVFIRREQKDNHSVHVQMLGSKRNRDYGAAFDIAFDGSLFGPFMAAVANMGVGFSRSSLAGTGASYMECTVLPSTNNTLTAIVAIGEIEALKIRNLDDSANGAYRAFYPFLQKRDMQYVLAFKFHNVNPEVTNLFLPF